MSTAESEKHGQSPFALFILFIGIVPMVFSSLPLPIGDLAQSVIMISIYLIGSIVSWWYWNRPRASIGWLFFAVSMSVLLITGVKNNPPAIIVFFGSMLIGFGLIVSEGIAEVEKRDKSTS